MYVAQHAQGHSDGRKRARMIFEGIRKEQFWIFAHDDVKASYQARVDSVIEPTNPEYQIYVTPE